MEVADTAGSALALPVFAPVALSPDRSKPRKTPNAVRLLAFALLVVALATTIWFQRDTMSAALTQIGQLSIGAVGLLAAFTVYERWSRADIVRRLLGENARGESVGIGRAVTIHDVGTAVSKGVPLGGAVGTALRWTIARESGVDARRFSTVLIAYGVATTFVSWLLPLAALLADLTQRSPDHVDLVMIAVIVAVVAASAGFWVIVLRSDRLESWSERRTAWLWAKVSKRVSSLGEHDPASGVADVRRQLLAIGRRPWSLLARTMAAQACGSVILLVALRSVGVGDELGVTEFFRVFFITHVLGTFAPTPGGIGVVEAGATGALTAAGVDVELALAGVLVYRFLTYLLPIVFGAILYVVWRVRLGRTARAGPTTLFVHGASIDTAVPDVARIEDQGIRTG